jgi:hypothetical protein
MQPAVVAHAGRTAAIALMFTDTGKMAQEAVSMAKTQNCFGTTCYIKTVKMGATGTLVDGRPFGLPERTLLTNHHVLPSFGIAKTATATFFYDMYADIGKNVVKCRPDLGYTTASRTLLNFPLTGWTMHCVR